MSESNGQQLGRIVPLGLTAAGIVAGVFSFGLSYLEDVRRDAHIALEVVKQHGQEFNELRADIRALRSELAQLRAELAVVRSSPSAPRP